MEYDIKRLEECGIDTTVGIEYTGNLEKYITTLKRFYASYESNTARIRKDLKDMDIEDYTIAVHSLKSNSRMIGASELSSSFEALELAARSGNVSIILSDTADVLDRYDLMIKQLKPIGEDDDSSAAAKITADDARKITEELLEALDEYDDELSSSLAAKLKGYPFETAQQDMLDKAIGYIGDFMYDEAADIIREISAAIK